MHFDIPEKGRLHTVDSVSFNIMPSETVGLVGKSECGKGTVGNVMVRLLRATFGHVCFDKTDVVAAKNRELAGIRKKMQIIFQSPYSPLNPRETIQTILADPYQVHHMASGAELKKMARELMESIGLEPYVLDKFPHELDGGKRQLTGITRALALKPKFVICDKSVSALGVSVQATIIDLLIEMQEKTGLSCLFVSHDLSVIRHISNRVTVMCLGQIVELVPADEIFNNTLYPCTIALLSAVPKVDFHDQAKRIVSRGGVPSPMNPGPGCHFAPRCPMAQEFRKNKTPRLREVFSGHCVACHYWKEAQNLLGS